MNYAHRYEYVLIKGSDVKKYGLGPAQVNIVANGVFITYNYNAQLYSLTNEAYKCNAAYRQALRSESTRNREKEIVIN